MILWDKLKSFRTLYETLTDPVKEKYDLTQLEFDIVMFLENNPQYKTANDIVRVRHLTKSNVSVSVASLEKKGLLIRSYAEGNRKSIQLTLTPAAAEIIADGKAAQNTYAEILIHDFSEEEIAQFLKLFERTCTNVEDELKRRAK